MSDSSEDKSVNMAQQVRVLRENMPAIMEFNELIAKQTYGQYTALVKAGFSEEQAFELTTAKYAIAD